MLKVDQIVIPTKLRKKVLQILHKGHLGIENTRRLARQTVYRPGMNLDIAEMINDCATCLIYHNRQPREPLLTDMRAEYPLEKIPL